MKKIIDFVLRNRLLIIILGVFVIAVGYFSYKQLPIDACLLLFVSLLQLKD